MGLSEDDIRLATSWRGHRKRKKLKRILGAEGVLALIDLWIGVAVSRPNGVLTGWSAEDIALEADWEGEPDVFVSGLIEAGFLEADGITLHDWAEYQGWVMGKEARVAKAKKGAEARWGNASKPKEQVTSNAPSMPEACPEHAHSNAPLHSSPHHTSPEEQESSSNSSSPAAPDAAVKPLPPCPVSAIIQAYHSILPERPQAKSKTKISERIHARWKEDAERRTLGWWEDYFQSVRSMPWLMGKQNWTGCNLHWLTGKDNVEKVLNGQYQARAPNTMDGMLTRQGEKNYRVAMEWAAESGAKE